jgi:uncharacterized cupin superfamily protein
MLMSQMAGTADNNGAFDLVSKMRRGTEPPPHVYSREEELFYVLSGEMKVYVDREVFSVTTGECTLLPRQKPHAFLLVLDHPYRHRGFDTMTYANADLTETNEVFEQFELRLLSPDQIRAHMPEYPL